MTKIQSSEHSDKFVVWDYFMIKKFRQLISKKINKETVYFVWDIIKIIIIAAIVVWPIHKWIFQPFFVNGSSMEPNFHDRDYLIVDEISYKFKKLQRGEVIIFRHPKDPKNYLIKKIIGLPNERIIIDRGDIWIYNALYPSGLKLDENAYLFPGTKTPGKIDLILSPDQYFVLGDNRNNSLDSRSFGPIPLKSIVGRAFFQGWPLNNFGIITNPLKK